MITKPYIESLPVQPYVAIKRQLSMAELGQAAECLLAEVFEWLTAHNTTPAGAPFFKYNTIDMPKRLEIEFGVPTAFKASGDSHVVAGVLPAGRYATLVHRGAYDRLIEANAALLNWIAENRLVLDSRKIEAGDQFGCRLEVYLTDPAKEPNPEKWETKLAFRLADQ
jgi:effector-binding domain-containing protein